MAKYSADTITQAREMYARGVPVDQIYAATGMAVGTLYYYLDGGALSELRPPPVPRRRVVVGRTPAGPRRRPTGFAARLKRTAARAAHELSVRLADPLQPPEARERDLRALSMLARTLRDITVFEAHSVPPPARPPTEEELHEYYLRSLGRQAEEAKFLAEGRALVNEYNEERAREVAAAAPRPLPPRRVPKPGEIPPSGTW